MTNIPKPQEIYRHFKGNLYQIITVAEHSETGERLVIYQAMYGDFKIYARELGMFTSRVDRVKYPNAKQEYRFMLVDPSQEQTTEKSRLNATAEPVREKQQEELPAIKDEVKEASKEPTKETPKATSNEISNETSKEITKEPEEELEARLDPMLIEFLDAKTYEEKLNILHGLHHRITQDMITTMAVCCDVEVGDGDLEERYRQLKTCLITLEKYECNRMK